MTDAEIGDALRWLCGIPIEASIRIRIYCDECEMAFGAAHRANAGWVCQSEGETLVECLAILLAKRVEIDDWMRRHSGDRGEQDNA